MRRPVYVDIDDVLCHTTREIARLAGEHLGRRVPFERLHSFDLARSFDLDAEEHARLLELAHHPDSIGRYEPLAGAREVLQEWCGRGYAPALCTGRPPSTEAATRAWLERHRMPHASLHFVDKYGRFDGPGLEELAALDFAFAVEDSLEVAAFLTGRGVPTALLDRPWNRTPSRLPAGAVRCTTWTEIARLFEAL